MHTMNVFSSDRTMGVLWMNAAETWVDIRSTNADKSTFRNIVDYVKGFISFSNLSKIML